MKAKSKYKEYAVWVAMRQRCTNPKNPAYKNYGERGITVCSQWDDFFTFISDMGLCQPGLSIERVDNDKGYSPENCIWADRHTQNMNRRNSLKVTYHGVTKAFLVWCEELDLVEILGLSSHSIYCRMFQYGWSPEKAFTVPGETVAEVYVKGEMLSVKDICDKYNLAEGVVRTRKNKGLTDEDLVAPVNEAGLFTVDGVTKSVKEWATQYGINEPTARKWLLAGKSLDSKSIRSDIAFNGKSQTLINWATEWDLDRKDLSRYLVKQKYTMQEIYDFYVLKKDWAPLGVTKGTIREPIEFQGKRLYPSVWRERWGLTSSQFSRLRKKLTMQEIYDGHSKK